MSHNAFRAWSYKLHGSVKGKDWHKKVINGSYLSLSKVFGRYPFIHLLSTSPPPFPRSLCRLYFKGNLHCYNKLTLSRWKWSLKLNYPKNNWKYDFSVQKKWIWISPIFAFKFPARSHFEYLWRHKVAQLLHTKERRFLTIAATIWRHKNSKWRHAGSLKANIGDIHIHILSRIKMFFTFVI